MQFNSIEYLVLLFCTVLAYYILPLTGRKVFLLVTSFAFYMAWNAKYIFLMLAVICSTYAAALLLVHFPKRKKAILLLCLGLNLGLLFYFKYFNFFLSSVNSLFSVSLPLLDVVLPVGISFYVFQGIGYLLDVYHNPALCEPNILNYALFISFFPQLVAGPIERSQNILTQFKAKQSFHLENIKNGLTLILIGLVEKVVIADRLAVFVNGVFENYQAAGRSTLIVAVIFFAFQVYCDFNAYSLIAIGSAKMMGYTLMENFRNPYLSRNFSEYWSRWHISLSTWFNDYIFTPYVWASPFQRLKSASGKPPIKTGLLLVFLISGLWHGANWTFVIWGLLHAAYRIMEAATSKKRKQFYKKHKIAPDHPLLAAIQILLTFTLNCFTYVFFRANSIGHAFDYLKQLVVGSSASQPMDTFGMNRGDLLLSFVLIGVLVLCQLVNEKRHDRRPADQQLEQQPILLQSIVYAALLLALVVLGMYGTNYVENPFIYFQF